MAFFITVATKECLHGTNFPLLLMFAGGLYCKIPDQQIRQSAFKYAGRIRSCKEER